MITRELIEAAIRDFDDRKLFESSLNLLKTLGYESEKRLKLQPNTADEFKDFFEADAVVNPNKIHWDEWKQVEVVFQLTETELTKQNDLFSVDKYDATVPQSYLFVAIQLKDQDYPRGYLADITRQVNRVFPYPVMVLFSYGTRLSFSVIDRRPNKRELSKDVLEKITIIKDIDRKDTNRAHIEILFDLAVSNLHDEHEFVDFGGFHDAWRQTLSISELNKRFFKELANWYFWAISEVEFPDDAEKNEETRNATSVIRLITRLIFVWFIKEKGLVPDNLFKKKEIDKYLNYKDPRGSTYYKAILQNLFFATLNTEMDRDRKGSRLWVTSQYLVQYFYRYEDYFKDKSAAMELFKDVPFLNGGLFENLDRKAEDGKSIRIDCFSKNPKHVKRLCVPDDLFFGEERGVDLSKVYDDPRRSNEKVRGILNILNSYKFTVAENTPLEEEVALDPELLGKVFENLLANYNPETKTTARKQTGSFYTPREIVNYMVDESLIAYLLNHLPNVKDAEAKLRQLFAYDEQPNPFNEVFTETLIRAIDQCKILDPACGSGAFPMGVLHRMVSILHKLDPHNELWKKRQLENVERIEDPEAREHAIADVEESFENNELDYGRKLYLIESCIYGVDIQPIACQIAKLRFFISLIVDQRVDRRKKNLGVRPLPNLETKFVAANTLIGIERSAQQTLRNPNIDNKEEELRLVRERHFTARTPKTKEKYREIDANLRKELAGLLKTDGFDPEATKKLASWNPYDQNASASFFDSEWMFGMKLNMDDGFDIVIGNPPYVRVQHLSHSEIDKYKEQWSTAWRRIDVSTLFIECGKGLLRNGGHLCFISSNQFITTEYGRKMREFLIEHQCLKRLVDFGDLPVFDNTLTYVSIFLLSRSPNDSFDYYRLHNLPFIPPKLFVEVPLTILDNNSWSLGNANGMALIKKLKGRGERLDQYGKCWAGIITGNDKLLLYKSDERISHVERQLLIPVIRSQDCGRYKYVQPSKQAFYPYNEHKNQTTLLEIRQIEKKFPKAYSFIKSNQKSLKARKDSRRTIGEKKGWYGLIRFGRMANFQKEKIVSPGEVKGNKFSLDLTGSAFSCARVFSITSESPIVSVRLLLGILNSKLIEFYLHNTASLKQGGYYSYSSSVIDAVPLRRNLLAYEKIEVIVNEILRHRNNPEFFDTTCMENEIDLLVYKLYGLSYEEAMVVDPNVAQRQLPNGKYITKELYESTPAIEALPPEQVLKAQKAKGIGKKKAQSSDTQTGGLFDDGTLFEK